MAREGYSYHVFLSFRGTDTRDKFTCLLNDALTRAGLVTFMDDEDIHSGEEIDSRIQEGIKRSMSAIVVFSEDYASSKWCLDELLLILERKRTSVFTLLPIYYYGAEPADIKYQRKKYGEALENHKKRYKDRIDLWRNALAKVGDYKGTIVAGKLDKFLNKIVKEVRKELGDLVSMINPPTPSVNPQLGGIIQSTGLPYVLNLHPSLGHMESYFNVTMPNLTAPQEGNNIKDPENEDGNTSQIKEEYLAEEPVNVDPTPSKIELSDQLLGYPKKCPPGGEDKVVLYTSLGGVKSMIRDSLKLMKILRLHELDFEEREESEKPEFRNELKNLVGGVSYPRLFVLGREVGGFLEVEMLHKSGQLSDIVQYYKQELEKEKQVPPPFSDAEENKEDDDDQEEEEDEEQEEEEEGEGEEVEVKVEEAKKKNQYPLSGCPKICPPGGHDKVVIYTWITTTVISPTTKDCVTVKKILQDNDVDFEERDVKKHPKFIKELQGLKCQSTYPSLFVMGRYLGEMKHLESINKSGRLESILQYFKMHKDDVTPSTLMMKRAKEIETLRKNDETNKKMNKKRLEDILLGFEIKCPPRGKGKVVLYTSWGSCEPIMKILRDKDVEFEERNIRNPVYIKELQRMNYECMTSRLYVMGRYIGDKWDIESMIESGQLESILVHFKNAQ